MNNTNSTAILLISVSLFFFFTKPMLASLTDLLAKKDEYQNTLDKLNQIEDIKKNLTDKINGLSDQEKKNLQVLLPDGPETTKLVADIDGKASKHGISIDKISYGEINRDQGQSVSEGAPPPVYQSELLGFEFTTDYSHLKDFLADIESSLRLIDIRSVDVNQAEKGINNRYRINAEIYWLNVQNKT